MPLCSKRIVYWLAFALWQASGSQTCIPYLVGKGEECPDGDAISDADSCESVATSLSYSYSGVSSTPGRGIAPGCFVHYNTGNIAFNTHLGPAMNAGCCGGVCCLPTTNTTTNSTTTGVHIAAVWGTTQTSSSTTNTTTSNTTIATPNFQMLPTPITSTATATATGIHSENELSTTALDSTYAPTTLTSEIGLLASTLSTSRSTAVSTTTSREAQTITTPFAMSLNIGITSSELTSTEISTTFKTMQAMTTPMTTTSAASTAELIATTKAQELSTASQEARTISATTTLATASATTITNKIAVVQRLESTTTSMMASATLVSTPSVTSTITRSIANGQDSIERTSIVESGLLTSSHMTTTTLLTTSMVAEISSGPVGLEPALEKHVKEQEEALVSHLLSANVSSMSVSTDDAVVTAHRLAAHEVASAGGQYSFEVHGTPAAVTVPIAIFSQAGEDVFVLATAYKLDRSIMDSQGEKAVGLVSVKVASVSSPTKSVHIQGLQDPVQIQLTTKFADGAKCVYWDTARSLWSFAGLATSQTGPNGEVVCSSSHLTLFGSIFTSLADTFVCSQLVLFRMESIAEIAEQSWKDRPDAWLLWGMLSCTLLMFIWTACLDCQVSKQGLRSDEFFFKLIEDAPGTSKHEENSKDFEKVEEKHVNSNTQVRTGCGVGCALGCCAGFCLLCCKGSNRVCKLIVSVGKPLCQQTIGNINDYYSVLMDLYGGLQEQAELQSGEERMSRCRMLWNLALAKALTTSIQLQVCSSLRMAPDDVQLFIERLHCEKQHQEEPDKSKGLRSSYSQIVMHRNSSGIQKSLSSRTVLRSTTRNSLASSKSEANMAYMEGLKDTVREALERHYEEVGSCKHLPKMFARLFLAKNPWVIVSQFSLYTPASLSMMLLMTEVLGDMAIAALFYRADGAKAKGGSDGCSGGEFWDAVGKMLAIGIVAALFAVVPQIALAKIRQRDFKEIDREDSIAWKRQLRKWHCQDIVVWAIGISYISFCLFFVMIFISNVSTYHGLLWMVSAALAIGQSAFLVPFVIASVLTSCAFMAARSKRVKKAVRRSISYHYDMEDPDSTHASRVSLRSTGSCITASPSACESLQPEPEPESVSRKASISLVALDFEPSPQYGSELPLVYNSEEGSFNAMDEGSSCEADPVPQQPRSFRKTSLNGMQFEATPSLASVGSNGEIAEEFLI